MTPLILMDALKEFVEECTKDMQLLVRAKSTETPETKLRAPTIYKMDLPRKEDDLKLAPFVVVQFLTGTDQQKPTQNPKSIVTIRFVTVCYCEDMGEGKMNVLNVIQRIRNALLKRPVITEYFTLADGEDVEYLVNPNPPAPYFDGELFAKFEIPPIVHEFDYTQSAGNLIVSDLSDREEETECLIRR